MITIVHDQVLGADGGPAAHPWPIGIDGGHPGVGTITISHVASTVVVERVAARCVMSAAART